MLHRAFELRFKHLPCEAPLSRRVEIVAIERFDVGAAAESQLSATGVILPSSGDYQCRSTSTHLYFGFGQGRGHFVLFLGLEDLLYKATCSSRHNEGQVKNSFNKKQIGNATFELGDTCKLNQRHKKKNNSEAFTVFVLRVKFCCRPL